MNLVQRGGQGPDAMPTTYLQCPFCNDKLLAPRGSLTGSPNDCAICGFQVLIVLNTETNKSHNVCPKCFRYSHCCSHAYQHRHLYLYRNPPGPPFSEEGVGEFRCFQCAHPTCSLAGRTPGADINIATCGCGSQLRLQKQQSGKLVVRCSSSVCKYSWYLPKFVLQGESVYIYTGAIQY
jgi:hypothetical protein